MEAIRRGGARDNLVLKILIGIVLTVLITLMFPRPESVEYNRTLGAVWADKDLIAPYSFPIFKELHQYEKEVQEASRSVPPVFQRHDEAARAEIDSVAATFRLLRSAIDERSRWQKSHHPVDSIRFSQFAARIPFSLTDEQWNLLEVWRPRKGSAKPETQLEESLIPLIADIARAGIIDQAKVRPSQILLATRKGSTEELVPSARVNDLGEAQRVLESQLAELLDDDASRLVAVKTVNSVLRPNLIFDQPETNRAIQEAQDNVPRTVGFVQENERIIGKHERITEDIKLKLDSFQKSRLERGAEYNEWWHWLGLISHVLLLVSLYGVYLFLFRKRIFHDNRKLTLVALLLLMETFFAYLTTALNFSEPVQYLIFVPAASMLLTIIFDSRVAFYGTVTMALLIAGIKGNDYAVALTSLVPGALAAYTVRDIRNRTQIFRSLIFIYFGYAISITALSLERFESVNVIAVSLTYALANAVFSPVLTYGLLIFFERVFLVTTDLTLLELSDFNQPLLRQLSEKAPGTFHHSMLLGNLAESAAEAIGANSILARVGAYYHDIGKMLKPEYFVENQVGSNNRHVRLKPRMSAHILAAHVKDGADLGRKYGLPEKVLDFIPQHHGTTLMSFFYDKALKQAAKKAPKETLTEDDFRYPGPRPQSRETGIVMLADSVEASTRAITDMSPPALETAIENMIKQRFLEGQLDECNLTLRDLTKIKEAFFKILIGIHHQRIKYPEQILQDQAILGQLHPVDQMQPEEFTEPGEEDNGEPDSQPPESDTSSSQTRPSRPGA